MTVPTPGAPATAVSPVEMAVLQARAAALSAAAPPVDLNAPTVGAEPGELGGYQAGPPAGAAAVNAADSALAREGDQAAAILRASNPHPMAPPPQVPGYPAPQPQAAPGYPAPQPPVAPPGTAGYPAPAPYPQPVMVPTPGVAVPQMVAPPPHILPQGQPYQGLPAIPPPPPPGVAPGAYGPSFDPRGMPPPAPLAEEAPPPPQAYPGIPQYQPPPQAYPMQQPVAQPMHPGFAPPAVLAPNAPFVERDVQVMDPMMRLGYACDLITKLFGELRQRGVNKNQHSLRLANDFLALCGRGRIQ